MIRINLLKPKSNSRKSHLANRFSLSMLVVSATVFISFLCWYLLLQSKIESRSTAQLRLREEYRELDRLEALIVRNRKERQRLDQKSIFLDQLRLSRLLPIKLLGAIADTLPIEPTISLKRLALAEHQLHLSGRSLDLKTITDCVRKLEASPLFESVDLSRWDTDRGVFSFEIICILED